jgi:hypothetical protein
MANGLPPEAIAQAQTLGVDTGPIFGGEMANDPQDLPVRVGRKRRAPKPGVLGGGAGGEFTAEEEAQFLYGGVPADYTREFSETKLQSQLEKEFYSRNEDDLSDLQGRLWAGGFYGQGVRADEIIRGDYDEQTYAAYQKAVQRAARFNAAGADYTLDEVIDMASGAGDEAGGRGRGTGSRQPLSVALTNPDDLRKTAQRAAVSILGRGFKPDELNRFVSSFHAAQSGAQAGNYRADEAGGTVVQAASPEAAAEAFAQRAAPAEAGAHDFVRVYDAFTKILGRRG